MRLDGDRVLGSLKKTVYDPKDFEFRAYNPRGIYKDPIPGLVYTMYSP